jgi:pilus assembly protein Flp/PilA
MKSMWTSIKRFVRDEEGVTAIEYGLIAALIAVVIIGNEMYSYISSKVQDAISGS